MLKVFARKSPKKIATIEKSTSENHELRKDREKEKSVKAIQEFTAEYIAHENGIEYIHNFKCKKRDNEKGFNRFYAVENRYILIHPANDGMPTCPFEWYYKFNGSSKKIIDNQTSFESITNLAEIILKMIEIYTKYIDDDVVIASYDFAMRLNGKICSNYKGEASLVFTKHCVRNDEIKPERITEAKNYFINDFLDHFIGWNFGVVIENNPELEKAINDFNELVISKGIRKFAGPGFNVWHSEKVKHYDLKRKVE